MYQYDDESLQNIKISPFDDKTIRMKFIRKVYGILTA